MSKTKRDQKRWKRENRAVKGLKERCTPSCPSCGYKLTKFGCPHCNPSIGSIGVDMYNRGQLSGGELSLVASLAGRR